MAKALKNEEKVGAAACETALEKEKIFTKEQLLNSERFREKRDLARAVLADGKKYSAEEAEKIIDKFLKGSVR